MDILEILIQISQQDSPSPDWDYRFIHKARKKLVDMLLITYDGEFGDNYEVTILGQQYLDNIIEIFKIYEPKAKSDT